VGEGFVQLPKEMSAQKKVKKKKHAQKAKGEVAQVECKRQFLHKHKTDFRNVADQPPHPLPSQKKNNYPLVSFVSLAYSQSYLFSVCCKR
jgi:hypothetical protein